MEADYVAHVKGQEAVERGARDRILMALNKSKKGLSLAFVADPNAVLFQILLKACSKYSERLKENRVGILFDREDLVSELCVLIVSGRAEVNGSLEGWAARKVQDILKPEIRKRYDQLDEEDHESEIEGTIFAHWNIIQLESRLSLRQCKTLKLMLEGFAHIQIPEQLRRMGLQVSDNSVRRDIERIRKVFKSLQA